MILSTHMENVCVCVSSAEKCENTSLERWRFDHNAEVRMFTHSLSMSGKPLTVPNTAELLFNPDRRAAQHFKIACHRSTLLHDEAQREREKVVFSLHLHAKSEYRNKKNAIGNNYISVKRFLKSNEVVFQTK